MGYYMRYIVTDSREITLAMIDSALKQIDAAYSVTFSPFEDMGDLIHDGLVCGQIEINRPGDDIFEEDLADLKELVDEADTEAKQRVLDTLDNARLIVTVEAVWQGTDADTVLRKIDPLWDWLFDHYKGLLQVDNEGYYSNKELVLEQHLKI